MTNIPDLDTFVKAYAGQPPWETGRPQRLLVDAADQIQGAILDVGCGTGENALFFAARGHPVIAIDFVPDAIARARQKARERGAAVDFRVQDALTLQKLAERFDTVIDSGLFHVFSDGDRQRYVTGLAHVLKPGGQLFLLCFSDAEPGTHGPRRITEAELKSAFEAGWQLEMLRPVRFDVRPNLKDIAFTPGGPHAWFAILRHA